VVGATGVVNTLADVLLQYWQGTEIAAMLKPYEGQPPPARLASMEESVTHARAVQPGMAVAFIAFPGTPFASSHHYGIYMRGDQALTARLYKPVLVDAGSGQVTDQRTLPWYLSALLLSQPLHFGDYGGAGMKFLWALLDLATIVVLGSGLYLWLKRGRAAAKAGAARPVPEVVQQ
jgi:uncharacterized iron-regulated membrane protein